jgi:hypothetical protein
MVAQRQRTYSGIISIIWGQGVAETGARAGFPKVIEKIHIA